MWTLPRRASAWSHDCKASQRGLPSPVSRWSRQRYPMPPQRRLLCQSRIRPARTILSCRSRNLCRQPVSPLCRNSEPTSSKAPAAPWLMGRTPPHKPRPTNCAANPLRTQRQVSPLALIIVCRRPPCRCVPLRGLTTGACKLTRCGCVWCHSQLGAGVGFDLEKYRRANAMTATQSPGIPGAVPSSSTPVTTSSSAEVAPPSQPYVWLMCYPLFAVPYPRLIEVFSCKYTQYTGTTARVGRRG
jgi:hypothetical protein